MAKTQQRSNAVLIDPQVKPTDNNKFYIGKPISRKPVNLDSIEAMSPQTDKKVKGTFINIESPGMTARVCGKYYKGMQYFDKVFNDGEQCIIPLSVARYINERICYERHQYAMDEKGQQIKSPSKIHRYKFMIEEVL